MKKYYLKNETMTEIDLKKIFNFSIYPRDFKLTVN